MGQGGSWDILVFALPTCPQIIVLLLDHVEILKRVEIQVDLPRPSLVVVGRRSRGERTQRVDELCALPSHRPISRQA